MGRWRFLPHELDIWCDGRTYELTEGENYPPGASTEQLAARLERAARRRQCTARVWLHAPGVIRFVFVHYSRGSARVIEPGQ